MSDDVRGSGRTKQMVMCLPEGGCVVVVHDVKFISYVRTMIGNIRGPEFLRTVKIVSLDNVYTLVGLDLPIHVDHYVFDFAFEKPRYHRDLARLQELMAVQRCR